MMVARKRAKLKQRTIAGYWGVTIAYISNIETGKKPFPMGRLIELPVDIRQAVVGALIEERERSIEELRAIA